MSIKEIENIKFRCSSLGDLMTPPRAKSDKISKTAKAYLQDLYKEALYGRKKEIESKYLDKGTEVEQQSINLLNQVKYSSYKKNEERFTNDYLTGEPDIITDNSIIDVKSSWSFFTFPFFEEKIPHQKYFWQIIGYCILTNKTKGQLIYCLSDTPAHEINRELKQLDYKHRILDFEGNILEEHINTASNLIKNHIFSQEGLNNFCNQSSIISRAEVEDFIEIPNHKRVKIFDIECKEEHIEKVNAKMIECRNYLNELANKQ